MEEMSKSVQVGLKRTLKTKDLIIYGLVFMIPLGPAGMYGAYLSPSSGMVALCYLIGMAAMFFTGMSYRIMSKKYPMAGSVYVYVQKSVSPTLGFLTGWSILLDYLLLPATVIIIGSNSAHALFPTVPLWIWAIAFTAFSTIVNIIGVDIMSKCSWILFALQIIVIVAFIACVLRLIMNGTVHFNTVAFYNPKGFEISGLLQATGIVILSYLGFDAISTLAEEAVDSEKSVGRAIIYAIIIIGIIFIVITYFCGVAYPDYQKLNPDTAFIDIIQFVGGKWLTLLTTITLVLSFGVATTQASQAAVARILFAMGRDGVMPKKLASISKKSQTPYVAILFVGALILPIAIFCDLTLISTMVSFGALFGFMLLNLAIIWKFFIQSKKSKQSKNIKEVLAYFVFPSIGFLVTIWIFLNLGKLAHIVGFGWLFAGFFYLVTVTKGFQNPVPQLDME